MATKLPKKTAPARKISRVRMVNLKLDKLNLKFKNQNDRNNFPIFGHPRPIRGSRFVIFFTKKPGFPPARE
jgi:hypothetical protein